MQVGALFYSIGQYVCPYASITLCVCVCVCNPHLKICLLIGERKERERNISQLPQVLSLLGTKPTT